MEKQETNRQKYVKGKLHLTSDVLVLMLTVQAKLNAAKFPDQVNTKRIPQPFYFLKVHGTCRQSNSASKALTGVKNPFLADKPSCFLFCFL